MSFIDRMMDAAPLDLTSMGDRIARLRVAAEAAIGIDVGRGAIGSVSIALEPMDHTAARLAVAVGKGEALVGDLLADAP